MVLLSNVLTGHLGLPCRSSCFRCYQGGQYLLLSLPLHQGVMFTVTPFIIESSEDSHQGVSH